MNLYCVGAGAWQAGPRAVAGLVERLQARGPSGDVVLIDAATLARDGTTADARGEPAGWDLVDLRRWVHATRTPGGTLDLPAVRRHASALAGAPLLAIDARGFLLPLVDELLVQLRIGLYGLAQDPRALVLLCDDALALEATARVAQAFHIRAQPLDPAALDRLQRRLGLRAWLMRLGGPSRGSGRWSRRVQRVLERLQRRLERRP